MKLYYADPKADSRKRHNQHECIAAALVLASMYAPCTCRPEASLCWGTRCNRWPAGTATGPSRRTGPRTRQVDTSFERTTWSGGFLSSDFRNEWMAWLGRRKNEIMRVGRLPCLRNGRRERCRSFGRIRLWSYQIINTALESKEKDVWCAIVPAENGVEVNTYM